MDEVTIGDKTYISSKRAAELTGYAKDYVGQLCREGHVDAKMVGRGWYVYEPSIMRHRFGDPREVAVSELPQQVAEEPKPAVSTWDPPIYKAETPVYMAEIKVPEESRQAEEDTTLTDMQTAWREWFDKKRQEELEAPEALLEIESPEVIDVREEEYRQNSPQNTPEANKIPEPVQIEENEVVVPLHHLQEESIGRQIVEEDEAPVAIQRMPAAPLYAEIPAKAPQALYESEARIIREQVIRKGSNSGRRARGRSNAPIIALLIAVSLISIAIAVIGSGLADRYITTFAGENRITQYLVGERVLNK